MIRLLGRPALCALAFATPVLAQNEFVNFESAHVHPIDLTPDGSTLLAVNTAAARLEVFDVDPMTGIPTRRGAIKTGMDPVTVRALTNDIAWVINQISDSISIVDLNDMTLENTLRTPDEPCDLVFTGTGGGSTIGTAWVSCAQPAVIARFDLANLSAAPQVDSVHGKDPTGMAVSPSEDRVYVAFKTSGNRTTVLAGGQGMMPDIVSDPGGPYGGVNPPPNDPNPAPGPQPLAVREWDPDLNPSLVGTLEKSALIVRKETLTGPWVDDNGEDWTQYVSGSSAPQFGRVAGWDMADHDIAIIDATATTFTVTYAKDCMNIVSSIAIQPLGAGHGIAVAGTEAHNERRFEPNLNGTFADVVSAIVDPATATRIFPVADLNLHLPSPPPVTSTQAVRDQSIGDPRAQIFSPSGLSTWIAGMGSNNVLRLDYATGARTAIEVGSGPTGLAINGAADRIFVLNKFEGSITVLNDMNSVVATVPYPDPTPLTVKRGRKHLYDTHRTSGNGQVSCATCHVDARMDGLAWDLGNPEGAIHYGGANNTNFELGFDLPSFREFHPMKGPMTTQTLQDIIGKEPFHWRGDRRGIEEFNGAYEGLQGDDAQLTAAEMGEFRDFLASIWIPPNPYRFINNEFNSTLDLTPFGMFEFTQSPGGNPLSVPTPLAATGDPMAALSAYRTAAISNVASCVTCHSLPIGIGADYIRGLSTNPAGVHWSKMPTGENGNAHSLLQNFDLPAPQSVMKIAQLRNMHEKTGFDMSSTESIAGFGYFHDGSVDTLATFMSNQQAFNFANVPGVSTNQAVSDMVALMLSFSGTRMPKGDVGNRDEPPGIPGQNAHAGIGYQRTLTSLANPVDVITEFGNLMGAQDFAESNNHDDIALIAYQNDPVNGGQRSFRYQGGGTLMFDDDDNGQIDVVALITSIGTGSEITLMMVPYTERTRLSVDADLDMEFDQFEINAGTDPDDPESFGPCTAAVPTAPSGVTVVVPNSYQVNLTWTDNSTDEDGFIVERAWPNSLQFETVAVLRQTNLQRWVDQSVGVNTDYVYRVRAFNCAGRSMSSPNSPVATTLGFASPVPCHISEITGEQEPANPVPPGPNFWGIITVVDDQDRPVSGALVTADVSGVPVSATTNAEGQALYSTPMSGLPAGNQFVVTVTGLSGTNLTYDSTANFVTSYVYRP